MNDIYTQNQQEINNGDYFGSGHGDGRYNVKDEKKERLRESRLPIVLMIFMMLCVCLTGYIHQKELRYYFYGNKGVATYDQMNSYVVFHAPDEKSYSISTGWTKVVGNTATVYYMQDDYAHAIIMTPLWIWFGLYAFFGGLTILCIYLIYRKFHPKMHVERK
jgi:hypothetical protein